MMDTKISQALESLEPTLVELLNRWIAVPSVKAVSYTHLRAHET